MPERLLIFSGYQISEIQGQEDCYLWKQYTEFSSINRCTQLCSAYATCLVGTGKCQVNLLLNIIVDVV